MTTAVIVAQPSPEILRRIASENARKARIAMHDRIVHNPDGSVAVLPPDGSTFVNRPHFRGRE